MPDKKILIIDGDAASRNFIARSLMGQKYEVIQAGSGKEGLIHAWRDRPDLAIIDPAIADLKGEDIAVKLRQDARTSKLPLIALSSDPSVGRIKSCLDAGFNEYIAKSGQALPVLQETINRLFGISVVAVKEGGLLIVCLSAKGGVGVSSLCVNFATGISMSQPEARIAVADLVQPIGSLASIVGYAGTQNIITATDMNPLEATPEYFRENLQMLDAWRFRFLGGSPDPESGAHLQPNRVGDIIMALKRAYDYVVLDVGSELSRVTLPLIQNADLVTFVINSDAMALGILKTYWDYLKNKGVKDTSVYTVLNRAVGLEGLSKPDAEKLLGLEIKTALPYLGNAFTMANNTHHPFLLKFPRETASIVFRDAARDMCTQAARSRVA